MEVLRLGETSDSIASGVISWMVVVEEDVEG